VTNGGSGMTIGYRTSSTGIIEAYGGSVHTSDSGGEGVVYDASEEGSQYLLLSGVNYDASKTNGTILGVGASDVSSIDCSATAADNLASILTGSGVSDGVEIDMKSLTITNSAGDAVTITASSGNNAGLAVYGSGSGSGVVIVGGDTGSGLGIAGGASSGAGIHAMAQANNDAGMLLEAHGTGTDLDATVSLVKTATTLTGHTPQTGDTYSLANGATGFTAIDTVVDAILEDTNELQTDWKNGGRLDALLDAVNTVEPDPADTAKTLTEAERNAIADALLDRTSAIDSKTLRQALQCIAAIVAGKVSGAGTGTEVFKGLDGETTRATVTADTSGNRSNVTYG